MLLPTLHGDCVHFQRKQLLLPILHGDCVHFQRKQLLFPILHGDCVANFTWRLCTFSEEATAIPYFTW